MPASRRWPQPIFVALQDVPVVVIGGGTVAERKIAQLVESGARVTVVAPDVTPSVADLAAAGRLVWKRRAYRAGDLIGARLAYAATSRGEVNRAVRVEAVAEGVWLNAVDQPELCDFISPALVRRGDLTIAISTNGRAPALAKEIREELERQFGEDVEERLEKAEKGRPNRPLHHAGLNAECRMSNEECTDSRPNRPLHHPGLNAECRMSNEECTDSRPDRPLHHAGLNAECQVKNEECTDSRRAGAPDDERASVALVGAGPGDPELLTLKGKRLLAEADTVVYDALVSTRLLAFCRPSAELVFVGKRDSRHTLPQAEINELLVARAREGRRIVRLKGGDPFIFGRGGEEAEALVDAGIPYEVVPGVSAGVAVPGYAGIPLTHRQFTSELVFLTGHECGANRVPIDWARYAKTSASLVIFMGVHSLPKIAQLLLDNGRDPGCPVAVIENGSTEAQRTVVAPLVGISDAARKAGVLPPALIVVGDVVRMRDKLAWFQEDGFAKAKQEFPPMKAKQELRPTPDRLCGGRDAKD